MDLAITSLNAFHTAKAVCENSRFALLDIVCDKTLTSDEKVASLRSCILEFRRQRNEYDPEKLPARAKLAISQAVSYLALGGESDQADIAGLMAMQATQLVEQHNEVLERIKNIVCSPESPSEEKVRCVENVLM